MVDMLMTQMSKLMQDMLTENNAQTQRQVNRLSQQVQAVATTADTNIQALHNAQTEIKQQIDQLQKTVEDKQGSTTQRAPSAHTQDRTAITTPTMNASAKSSFTAS